MTTEQELSWKDLKKQYSQNLKTLQSSINSAYDSAVEMNRIYSQVVEKSKNSSQQEMETFLNLWQEKLGERDISESYEFNEELERLVENPSKEKFQDLGVFLQKKVYSDAIRTIDMYRLIMDAFYSSWDKLWPDKSIDAKIQ